MIRLANTMNRCFHGRAVGKKYQKQDEVAGFCFKLTKVLCVCRPSV